MSPFEPIADSYIQGFGMVVGILGASLLLSFGFLYVQPYLEVRAMQKTDCVVTETEVTSQAVTCTCTAGIGSGCLSKYPCLRLRVNLTTLEGENLGNITLYDSLDTYHLQHDVMQCSYHKCNPLAKDNVEAVREFARTRADVGTRMSCYYEPSDLSFAICDIISRDTVIHGMFWSALACVTGLIIVIAHVLDVDTSIWNSKRLGGRHKHSNFSNSSQSNWPSRDGKNYERVESITSSSHGVS